MPERAPSAPRILTLALNVTCSFSLNEWCPRVTKFPKISTVKRGSQIDLKP